MNDIIDKKRGCFYGLAIGDALGAAVEFREPGTFALVTGYRSGGPHGLNAGEWTDDTSMALALADSIAQGWNTKDQLTKYLEWFQNGKYSVNDFCFDIGTTTRSALCEFELNGTLISDDDPINSGNGSIMRLAPVVIKYCNHVDESGYNQIVKFLEESSKTTHASNQCTSACIGLGFILMNLINGSTKSQALDFQELDEIDSGYNPLIEKVLLGSYETGKDIKGSGWVVKSLEAALWAFNTSDSFEECVLKAVNLGDDADTTGAVAGQLAGAYWGYNNIPQSLIDGLARKDMIERYLNPIL